MAEVSTVGWVEHDDGTGAGTMHAPGAACLICEPLGASRAPLRAKEIVNQADPLVALAQGCTDMIKAGRYGEALVVGEVVIRLLKGRQDANLRV